MKPYVLLVAPTSLVLKATAWLVTSVHTTATVYAFQKKLLGNIKVTHPSLTTIQMVVQGNIKIVIILLTSVTIRDCLQSGISLPHHMVKLHVMGLVEQQNGLPLMLVFRDPFLILIPQDMFAFCRDNIHGVHFHFVSNETIQEVDAALQQWFSECHTLKGTQRYHRYVPLSTTTLAVHAVSSGPRARAVSIF